MKINNNINERQNIDESIKMLAAQRQIYSDAKILTIWHFIVSIIVPLIIVILKPFFESNQKIYMTLIVISVGILIPVFIIKSSITTKKTRAAIIQNRFDYNVFGIPWDEIKFGDKSEINGWIYEGYNKYIKKEGSLDSLRDWYPVEYSSLSLREGIFYCQKCNVYWDHELKKQYKIVINTISLIVIITIFILAIINNDSVVALFFLKIIVPIIPAGFYLYTTNQELNNDITRLEKLKLLITNTSDLVNSKSIDDETLSKQTLVIQNEIYNNRKSGVLVLEFIYNRLKERQEQVAKDYAKEVSNNKD